MRKTRLIFTATVLIALVIGTGAGCKTGEKLNPPKIPTITPENVTAIMAPDENNLWIIGNYGIIFHSSDAGKNWVSQSSGIKTLLTDGLFIDNKNGWVVGVDGTIIHTADGGNTWVKQNSGTIRHLMDITFTDKDYGWAVGEFSTILHTTDGGTTWAPQQPEADKIYNSVCFINRQNGFVVGEGGTMFRTIDGGATWVHVMPKAFERKDLDDEFERPRPALFCVIFKDNVNGWACGNFGAILHTTDGGVSWNVLPNEHLLALYTMYIRDGKGWAVGDKGTYLTSQDGGLTWKNEPETIKTKQWFRDVVFTSPEIGWIVGASGTIIRTADGGKTWEFHSGLSYDTKTFKFFNDILAKFEKMMSE